MLVANNSLIARALQEKQEDDHDGSDESEIEESRSQRRRTSLEAAAGAIRSKNKFAQDVVSPQSIFVLQILRKLAVSQTRNSFYSNFCPFTCLRESLQHLLKLNACL